MEHTEAIVTRGFPPSRNLFGIVDWIQWIVRPTEFLDENQLRIGSAFTLRGLVTKPTFVFFSDPDAIKELFAASPDEVHAGEANKLVEGLMGSSSLLVLDGEAHRRQRKLMMPPFHGERMQAYGGIMRALATTVIDGWPLGEAAPIAVRLQSLTIDVILRTVFGLDEGPKMTRLRASLQDLMAHASHVGYFAASLFFSPKRVQAVLEAAIKPISIGFGIKVDASPMVPGTALAKIVRDVDEQLFAEFARRRELGTAGRNDVLSMLLDARDEDGQPMTDVELRDEMITLLLAGHDTTATSLTWTIMYLIENPEVAARLVAEIDAAADAAGGGSPDVDRVLALPYLDATIKETLRLSPVAPLVGRVLKRPRRIGGHELPAGTTIFANIYSTHRREDLYPEPKRFNPARFLERKYGPHEYLPFGGGNRRCLGATFAIFEMKIVLFELLRRLRFSSAGEPARLVRRAILLAPSSSTVIAAAR